MLAFGHHVPATRFALTMSSLEFKTFEFDRTYRCTVLGDAPLAGSSIFRWGALAKPPAGTTRHHFSLTGQSASWVGSVDTDDVLEPYYCNLLFATPGRNWLGVVGSGEGVFVNVDKPDQFARIEVEQIKNVLRVRDLPYILLHSPQDIAVYGPQGLVWYLERVAEDDLRITGCDATGIYGVVPKYSEHGDEDVAVRIDPHSGVVTGGWRVPVLRPVRNGHSFQW